MNRRCRKKLLVVVPAFLFAALLGNGPVSAQQRRAASGTGERHTFTHDDRERAYRLHVPEAITPSDSPSPVPLVICFHGGGGTAEVASRMGWTPLADRENFIVVYPEGLNKHWNDGRESPKFAEQDAEVDDVAFVVALLEKLKAELPVDPKRVFVTGASNGGFFSQRMAIEATDHLAAAGVLIATMPKPFADGRKEFAPRRPIPMLYMNGTEDPFVPYEGGPITPNFFPGRDSSKRDFGRGECSSTDRAIEMWLEHNQLTDVKPKVEVLPDKDTADGCTVEKKTWAGGKDGTAVVLYKIMGGGHTIPGGVQYLGERIIGKTCRDFDGIEAIWTFFAAQGSRDREADETETSGAAAQPRPGLAAIFGRLDRNGDGQLTVEEAPNRAATIRSADADKSGGVTLAELQAYLRKVLPPEPDPAAEPVVLVPRPLPEGAPVTRASCAAAAEYSAEQNGYSFLVMHDGEILFERYDQGWTPETPYRLASGTKSFSGVMLAAAVQDGLLSVDEPVSKTITEWKADPRLAKVTVRQLLSLTSGIDPGENSVVPSYREAINTESRLPPGQKFAYGPRAFQIFGELMTRKLRANSELEFKDPLAYLDARIFEPIGMEYATWRRDADGMPHLPSGASLTAREWAKFGEFLLNGGNRDGKLLVDPETLTACIRGSKANPGYGLTFWLLDAEPGAPKALDGAYMAAGKGKQRLYVIPKKRLAVVRQGESPRFDNREFLKRLLAMGE